ncbi:N-acetylmuramoyl-L-alanine amidase family protein [Pararhodospirillum oryzae]|uniref:N-acetylmuramoyl-L-alanine amidase family protein n=1 Tax=Pararhodospirillum oryzae TaxID=478448 RepID=UPI0014796FD6|nr:N-acetylmuramoyl-L-alanine amidase [Pararhodospirillum oryzae]
MGGGGAGGAAPAALACDPSTVVLGLDIGHTLARPGATSARGRPEFGFNQALGQTIAAAVRRDGAFRVVVINADGTMAGLTQRPAAARAAGATVFLSVHHDSVQPRYLQTWRGETGTGPVIPYSDRFSGFSVFVSAANPQPRESERWGRAVGRALVAAGLAPTLHHAEPIEGENRPLLDPALGLYRFDGLAVLRAATMPAALLEAGLIVNRADERVLASPAGQDRIARAVVGALHAYCAGLPASPEPPGLSSSEAPASARPVPMAPAPGRESGPAIEGKGSRESGEAMPPPGESWTPTFFPPSSTPQAPWPR